MTTHIQVARLHNQVQSLIPRYIFQGQGHGAFDGIAGNNIHTGFFCQNLQDGTNFYILEIQRNFTAFERFVCILVQTAGFGIGGFRRYFKYKASGRSFGIDVPIRIIVADNELGRITDTFERNVLYRRIEVSHIQTALSLCRQRMIFQGNNDTIALLFNVRLSAKTWGSQFNNAGIACTFAEIDIGC